MILFWKYRCRVRILNSWNWHMITFRCWINDRSRVLHISDVGQKPCSLEVLDGKLVLQQRVKKIKVIDNINLWTDAFLNFTMVLIENHPFKATELLRYMYIIRNIATCMFILTI
jgi:hypothetical protein